MVQSLFVWLTVVDHLLYSIASVSDDESGVLSFI